MKFAIQGLLLLALFAGIALDRWGKYERKEHKYYQIVGNYCFGERCDPPAMGYGKKGFTFDCVEDVRILPGNAYYVLVDFTNSGGNRIVTKASIDGYLVGPEIIPSTTTCKN